MNWNSPLVVAAYRGLVGGAVLAGVAFFAVLQADGAIRSAEIAAGAAFFGYLAARGAVEGLIDQRKATP